MNKYHVGDRTVVVIDGDLYERLPPLVDDSTVHAQHIAMHAAANGRRRTSRSHTSTSSRKPRRQHRIEPEDMARIKEMINAGYPAHEVATKFDVPAQYVYNVKMRMKKDGELTLTEQP